MSKSRETYHTENTESKESEYLSAELERQNN